ncbi:unnamed protein product [Ectocarpus sp. 4 AP-2014]
MSVLIQHSTRSVPVVTGQLALQRYTKKKWPPEIRKSKEINDRYCGVLHSPCALYEVTTETRSHHHGPDRKWYTPLVQSWSRSGPNSRSSYFERGSLLVGCANPSTSSYLPSSCSVVPLFPRNLGSCSYFKIDCSLVSILRMTTYIFGKLH